MVGNHVKNKGPDRILKKKKSLHSLQESLLVKCSKGDQTHFRQTVILQYVWLRGEGTKRTSVERKGREVTYQKESKEREVKGDKGFPLAPSPPFLLLPNAREKMEKDHVEIIIVSGPTTQSGFSLISSRV